MSGDAQQALTHVLQQDSQVLGSLLDKLSHLKHLNKILSDQLDPKLVTHCQVANYENTLLVILTHNAIWATQFRFQIPQLVTKLRQYPEFKDLKNIQCKLIPTTYTRQIPEAHKTQAMPLLSLQTSQLILDLASNIKYDKLREVMKRIAMHTLP